MPGPTDKTEDLIAELARLMENPPPSSPPGPETVVEPVLPVRIPGSPAQPPKAAAPVVRIPGGDKSPTSAGAVANLVERIAQRSQQDAPTARVEPAAEGQQAQPQVVVPGAAPKPPVATMPSPGFHFDFGLGGGASNAPPIPDAANDPIADLIAAELAQGLAPETAEVKADAVVPSPEMHAQEVVVPTLEPGAPAEPTVREPAARNKPTLTPVNPSAPRVVPTPAIPLKPVNVNPRSVSEDRFAASPDEGIDLFAGHPDPRPSLRAPDAPSDPMAEIESLIGEAVRVQLGPTPAPTPSVASPVADAAPKAPLPRANPQPVRTPGPAAAPKSEGRGKSRSLETALSGAEEAVMAAMAASGSSEPRTFDETFDDEASERRVKAPRARRSFGFGRLIGLGLAAVVVLVAAIGGYMFLHGNRASTAGTAPQLTADATPVKTKPPAAEKPETDSSKSPVMAKMNGAPSAASTEQLVSTDQSANSDVTRDVAAADTEGDDDSESGLANRKVRTVTVRPDGTIVSGDDAVAGAAELPVDRPNVPEVPGTDATSLLADTNTDTSTQVADNGVAANETTGSTASLLTSPSTDATAAITTATDSVANVNPDLVAPVPMPHLAYSNTPTNPVNAVVKPSTGSSALDLTANTTPAPAATTPAPSVPATTTAAAWVQLASVPTEADANSQARSFASRYASALNGLTPVVQKASVGSATRYRIRVPASSLSQANQVCNRIKAAGGECYATKG